MTHRKFFALLRGSEEVPPVKTLAFGTTVVVVSKDKQKLFFVLKVNNILKFTQAHLHLGPRGVNGPIVAFLFGPVMPGISVKHGVVTGVLTKKDLVGPLKGQSIARLIELMKAGKIYVNVHTEQHPDGEIRGQLKPSS